VGALGRDGRGGRGARRAATEVMLSRAGAGEEEEEEDEEVCVASGRVLGEGACVMCGRCGSVGLREEMRRRRHCPVCHQEMEAV
jgi:hypothetical protein